LHKYSISAVCTFGRRLQALSFLPAMNTIRFGVIRYSGAVHTCFDLWKCSRRSEVLCTTHE